MAGLSVVAVTVSVSDSFVAPVPMPLRLTVNRPASSFAVMSLIELSVGASFTDLTVRVKLVLVEAPALSVTVRVIRADPNWFGAGVIIRVRFVLVPDRDRFGFGTKTVFDELPVTTRLVAIFSTSLT